MNNIKLQTVYVPVDKPTEYRVERAAEGRRYQHVQRHDNRIVLTPQELNDLLLDYHPHLLNDPKPFLKSKGVEI